MSRFGIRMETFGLMCTLIFLPCKDKNEVISNKVTVQGGLKLRKCTGECFTSTVGFQRSNFFMRKSAGPFEK